jgi:hypothetical protein
MSIAGCILKSQVHFFVRVAEQRTVSEVSIELSLLYLRPSASRQEKGASSCVRGRQAVRRPSFRLRDHKANNSKDLS